MAKGRMKESRSSGSPAHHGEYNGPGFEEEGDEMPARGPGKAAETRHGIASSAYPNSETPKAEKKVSNRSKGQEESGG